MRPRAAKALAGLLGAVAAAHLAISAPALAVQPFLSSTGATQQLYTAASFRVEACCYLHRNSQSVGHLMQPACGEHESRVKTLQAVQSCLLTFGAWQGTACSVHNFSAASFNGGSERYVADP